MSEGVPGDLLERFARGDEDAFESLFRQFERDVYAWILRIVRDPSAAEDALVDAFWRAYRAHAHFDPSRSFGAWMRRIATNSALDQVALSRRHAVLPWFARVPRAVAPASDTLRESGRSRLPRCRRSSGWWRC